MKTLLIIAISLISLFQFSCKKNYTCLCSNPYIDSGGFTIKDTKKNAKRICKEYETNGKLTFVPTSCTIVN